MFKKLEVNLKSPIIIFSLGLLLLCSRQSSASFYCLHQENSILFVSSYKVGQGKRITRASQAQSIKLDLGDKEGLHWELKGASLSPCGHWLALLEDNSDIAPTAVHEAQRLLVVIDMSTHRQAWSKQEKGGWYNGTRSNVRWISGNRLTVLREFFSHDTRKHTILCYALDTYTAPNWIRTKEEIGRKGADRWEVLLTKESFRRRSGAAKLLNFLGYVNALPPYTSSQRIEDEIDDIHGAISPDGKAVVCIVGKIKQPWQLSSADTYRNHFILTWQSKRHSGLSGWRVTEIAHILDAEWDFEGVWLWRNWLVLHLINPQNKSALHFYAFGGSTRPIVLDGEIFVANY